MEILDSTAGAVKQCETELKRKEQKNSGLGKEKGTWAYGACDLSNRRSRNIAYFSPSTPFCRQKISCS